MDEANDVLSLLLNKDVQKEIMNVSPTFNRAELVAAILEAWGGQNNFAKDIYRLFTKSNEVTQSNLMKSVMSLISEESKNERSREVEDMTDDELIKAIKVIAPSLKGLSK